MITDIIHGVAAKLHQDFGDGYAIYTENIPQGFKEPCFSIQHIQSDTAAKLPNRHLRRNAFDVHFFPKPGTDEKAQMYRMAECLFLSLEYINVRDNSNMLDNLVRGSKMRYEIVDGVLHFFVNYDLYIKVTASDDGIPMEKLTSKSNVEE